MNKRKIIWEFWQNPYGSDNSNEFVEEDEAKVPSRWNSDDDNDEDENKPFKIRPVIPTPMGFLPVQPFQTFATAFEFWMGHTNFDVTQDVKEKIEAVEGVEILDVITRYCFRIAIGKVFHGKEVKLNIQKVLQALPSKQGEYNPNDMKLDRDTAQKLQLTREHLAGKFPHWMIFVLPNGKLDIGGFDEKEAYESKLDFYYHIQKLVGGAVYANG